jgi:RNA 3'-terminal phosphate cyclase (GTP)
MGEGEILLIDGDYGEGGGAILRQALGLAALAGRPICVVNIRARRPKPGLKPQHLKAVEAVRLLCSGRVEGAEPGSRTLVFEPGPVRAGEWRLDVGTAGSVSLVLQAALLPALTHRAVVRYHLSGGTDTTWSPPVDYLRRVTAAALAGFGRLEIVLERRGYYPEGGGRVVATIEGTGRTPPPFDLDRAARVEGVRGTSHAAASLREREVAERQARAAERELARLGVPVRIETEYVDTACPGSGIVLWTEGSKPPLGASALGRRGKPAEAVGAAAARDLLREIRAGAGIDRHLADQLIPFLAVAGGRLRSSRITGHIRSNGYVAERILGTRFHVLDDEGRIEAVAPAR